jgi:ankyrin repeat protein
MGEKGRARRWLLAICVLIIVVVALAVWCLASGQQQKRRNAALVQTVRAGDVKAAAAALDAGADINARDADGITPLMHAVHGDRPEIANPAATDHPEIVELLLSRGADVNARTDTGFVALFWTARYGHAGGAKLLIDHGADVNAKDKDGMTALRWATANKQSQVIELLKEAGAKE